MKRTTLMIAGLMLGAASFASIAHPGPGYGPGAGQGPHPRMLERIKAADTNADGMLSRQEAEAAMPGLAARFDAIDGNKDGLVTFDELTAYRQANAGRMGWHRLGGPGKRLDTDGDGRVSREEAQAAPRLAERFAQVDTDGDGFLTRDEMRAARQARFCNP